MFCICTHTTFIDNVKIFNNNGLKKKTDDFLRYAPESLRDGKFSSRSDVWSFGVTMYETFSLGEDPKLPDIVTYRNLHYIEEKGSAELLSALESGARLPCPPTCPQEIYTKLMYPCWNIQSHERPDFATLCRQIQNLLTKY